MEFTKIKAFWKESYLLVTKHNMSCMSAQLTYAVIVTIIPFFAVLFAFIQSRKNFSNIFDNIIQPFIMGNFGAKIGKAISDYIRSVANNVQVTELNMISLVSFLVTVILSLLLIESIFNTILDARIKKNYLISLLKCWLLIAFLPFLFVLITLRFEFLSTFFNFSDNSLIPKYLEMIRITFGYGLQALFFSLLFLIMPSRHPKYIPALIGGTITLIVLHIMRYINIYLVKQAIIADTNQLYGSFALIAILFFVWLRLVLFVILLGFVCTTAIERTMYPKMIDDAI